MTTPEYLSLSPEDRTKFFCESCGIEPQTEWQQVIGAPRGIVKPIGAYPTLTLDFLFEWARKQDGFDHEVTSYKKLGRYEAYVHPDIGESCFGEHESPTLALQSAILKWKGCLE